MNGLADKSCNIFLADQRVGFEHAISAPQPDAVTQKTKLAEHSVEEWPCAAASPELEELAVLASEQSRFAIDPRIPRHKREELYRIWIVKSCTRELAKTVIVVRDDAEPQRPVIAFVTLREADNKGNIGLISVASRCQGMGLGRLLVRRALAWSETSGHAQAAVVTQSRNTAACGLYESCGYARLETAPTYHIWL